MWREFCSELHATKCAPQMKEKANIKKLLGLSQDEMAALTGVTRSLWTMYEINQRDIPTAAVKIVTDLVLHSQQTTTVCKPQEIIIETDKKQEQVWLQKEYTTQRHKAELLKRKLVTMETIRKDCFRALKSLEYIEQFPDNITFKAVALDIRERVEENLQRNSVQRQQQLQLKLATAEFLLQNIAEKLKVALS